MTAPERLARVAVADAHSRFRHELAALLEVAGRCEIVGSACDRDGAVALVRRERPAVLILDAGLLPSTGTGEVSRLLDELAGTRLLVLITLADEGAAAAWARLGLVASLAKDADPQQLIGVVKALADRAGPPGADAAGGPWPAASAADELLLFRLDPPDPDATGPSPERPVVDARRDGGDAAAATAGLRAVVAGARAACLLSRSQARELAARRPVDLADYRLGQIAALLAHHDRSDPQLVRLALLVDRGEPVSGGRWQAQEERYDTLAELLAAVPDRVLVLLGEPGAGKTTLLRKVELAEAVGGLRGDTGQVAFAVTLAEFGRRRQGDALPEPGRWLAERWAARCPDLPPLEALLAEGRLLLLLDALNEMPMRSGAERREAVEAWRRFAVALAAGPSGNRLLVSCRRLDYSQPLSSAELRVPQVQIEPLTDDQVRSYLQLRAPRTWQTAWAGLAAGPELAVLRTPYYLNLFTGRLEEGRQLPTGRAALSTAFVREALWREVDAGRLSFAELLTERDRGQLAQDRWASDWELPVEGPLVAGLSRLAYRMQGQTSGGESSQVRLDLEAAIVAVDHPMAEAIVRAAEALNLLDRDPAATGLHFSHQLVQEYFAGRELAQRGDLAPVSRPWRADEVRPPLAVLLADLPGGETLPALPTTGWEETTRLAAAMAPDAGAFLERLMAVHLSLAGSCATQVDVLPRLSEPLLDRLRGALLARSRDRSADLRERIACARALGELGDPRFERVEGPFGRYLRPPMVGVAAGDYVIGDDAPIAWDSLGDTGVDTEHIPRHRVTVAAFAIGRFAVTNGEYACFMAAGGYDDERWWETDDARAWRRGELPDMGGQSVSWLWRGRFMADPGLLDRMAAAGRFANAANEARWRAWMALDDAAFEQAVVRHWRSKPRRQPVQWENPRFNHPSQPVVGVGWFEARAYCAWLSAQTGTEFRLPSEVEWEAAARGFAGRTYAYGDTFDPLACNTAALPLRQPVPVGVFVEGDSPDGICDLTGNVSEWTLSLWGPDRLQGSFLYPYVADDGREDPAAACTVTRVARGIDSLTWPEEAPTFHRDSDYADIQRSSYGFRLAASAPPR